MKKHGRKNNIMKTAFLTLILALATVIGFAQNRKHTDKERKLPTAHESMHAAQFLHGQGGASIYNEVEAYAFADYVTLNSWESNDFSKFIRIGLGQNENIYYKSLNNLYDPYKIHNPSFYIPSMLNATTFFKTRLLKIIMAYITTILYIHKRLI